jgi:hypothetical protein
MYILGDPLKSKMHGLVDCLPTYSPCYKPITSIIYEFKTDALTERVRTLLKQDSEQLQMQNKKEHKTPAYEFYTNLFPKMKEHISKGLKKKKIQGANLYPFSIADIMKGKVIPPEEAKKTETSTKRQKKKQKMKSSPRKTSTDKIFRELEDFKTIISQVYKYTLGTTITWLVDEEPFKNEKPFINMKVLNKEKNYTKLTLEDITNGIPQPTGEQVWEVLCKNHDGFLSQMMNFFLGHRDGISVETKNIGKSTKLSKTY